MMYVLFSTLVLIGFMLQLILVSSNFLNERATKIATWTCWLVAAIIWISTHVF